jgi:hypothetical protein
MATVVTQAVALMLGTPVVCLGGYHLMFRADSRERIVHWMWSILLWPELHERAAAYHPRHSLSAPTSQPAVSLYQLKIRLVGERDIKQNQAILARLA